MLLAIQISGNQYCISYVSTFNFGFGSILGSQLNFSQKIHYIRILHSPHAQRILEQDSFYVCPVFRSKIRAAKLKFWAPSYRGFAKRNFFDVTNWYLSKKSSIFTRGPKNKICLKFIFFSKKNRNTALNLIILWKNSLKTHFGAPKNRGP